MKIYGIKEIFGTLQGEGAQAGSPAVFLRFAGCNLGYDVCPWCDTDWVNADLKLSADETMGAVDKTAFQTFGRVGDGLLVVVTGGEPSLQLDSKLANALRARGYRVAMESNGSRPINRELVDWLTVSPKQTRFAQKQGNELKVVFTGTAAEGIAPTADAVAKLATGTSFENYFLQPVDVPANGGPNFAETIAALIELGPPWKLSVQTHKVAGLR